MTKGNPTNTPSIDDRELIERYRDIFAEITAKAQPECADESDPERITAYWIPVGPIHRAAGKLGFQMFDGEAHMRELTERLESLEEALRELEGAGNQVLRYYDPVKEDVASGVIAELRTALNRTANKSEK
jgi:hypothetical protein